MDSSATLMPSPSSDERFWSKLHDRVDAIIEHRKPKRSSTSAFGVESESGKRFKEDSLLLMRGLDSAAASLSQLTNSLTAAQQGLSDIAKPSLTNLQQREGDQIDDDKIQLNYKRHSCSTELPIEDKETELKEEANSDGTNEVERISADVRKSGNLKKAKNLAISMASKAASLARELKTIKSELCFMQERCSLLEEENRRLRNGATKGDRPEEDDLVRLQLEALLAEKSRLANENANLTRENQCLHQLVEYHQLATQDDLSSPPYDEQSLHGMCLDFSSPLGKPNDNCSENKDGCSEAEFACSPSTKKRGFVNSFDEEN